MFAAGKNQDAKSCMGARRELAASQSGDICIYKRTPVSTNAQSVYKRTICITNAQSVYTTHNLYIQTQ
jgi:hypothetical protein